MSEVEIATPHGPARAHLSVPPGARVALVLGHGAGGGIAAPDLRTAAEVAGALGVAVALVEQPYRVAGRRAPAPAPRLDTAWRAVVGHLAGRDLAGLALVTGGRSSGGRVACRTARDVGAVAVLCLAFPVRPPGRPDAPDRLGELDGAGVPVLVVQGQRDPFGVPPPAPGRTVVVVAGDHSLKAGLPAVGTAVREWLPTVVPAGA